MTWHELGCLWAVVGASAGVGVGIFLDELTSREITLDARVAAGVLVALGTPLLAPVYIARGMYRLHRTFFPKKIGLPEARVRGGTRA